MFLFKKNVDKSMLYVGMAIPKEVQKDITSLLGITLEKGEKANIKIVIENEEFNAIITRYDTNVDMMQIHYGAKSDLANRLRKIFYFTNTQLEETEILPNKYCEYAGIYVINEKVHFECITYFETSEGFNQNRLMQELVLEDLIDTEDPTACYDYKNSISKIRKVNSDIGKKLKKLYKYRCQICGESIGFPYGAQVAHIHHIDYFSKSMNNNADNLIVVCPNHHVIIHDQNPIFDKKNKAFIFSNGYIETLKLNMHLK